MIEPNYFDAQWGRIKLWLSDIQTDNSRRIIVHELTRGAEHPLSDRGPKSRSCRCSLLFDDFNDNRSPTDKFRELKAAVDSGLEAMFQHPLEGAFMAKVGEFNYTIDASSVITATIEFLAAETIDSVTPAGAGTAGIAGDGAVTQAAADLDAALAAAGMSTTVTATAVAAQAAWQSSTSTAPTSTRQVIVDEANVSNLISSLITTLNLENDLALWDVYRATIMLGAAMRSAAIAATSEVSSVFVMRVTRPVALLAIAARIYGGARAEDFARQIADLNDIRSPAWLAVGEYIFPTRPPRVF